MDGTREMVISSGHSSLLPDSLEELQPTRVRVATAATAGTVVVMRISDVPFGVTSGAGGHRVGDSCLGGPVQDVVVELGERWPTHCWLPAGVTDADEGSAGTETMRRCEIVVPDVADCQCWTLCNVGGDDWFQSGWPTDVAVGLSDRLGDTEHRQCPRDAEGWRVGGQDASGTAAQLRHEIAEARRGVDGCGVGGKQ